MVKWEYKELWLSVTAESDLNHLGVEGWELVAMIPSSKSFVSVKAYFKRPIKGEEEVYALHPSGEILPSIGSTFNRLMEEKERRKELLFQFRSMVLELLEAGNTIPSEVKKKAYLLIDSCYDDNGELIA